MFESYLVSGLCPSSSAPNEANISEAGSGSGEKFGKYLFATLAMFESRFSPQMQNKFTNILILLHNAPTKLTIIPCTVPLPVTNPSSQTSGLNLRALHVGFVVETVAL